MMSIVLVIELEYTEALQNHQVDVLLRSQDGAELGPRIGALLRVGHAPDLAIGSPIEVPMTLDAPGIVFPKFDRYEWVIKLDGKIEGILPISLERIPPQMTPFPGMVQPPPPAEPAGN